MKPSQHVVSYKGGILMWGLLSASLQFSQKIIFFLVISPFSLSTDDWCIAKKAYAEIVGVKSVFSHKQWKCMSTFLPLHIEKIIHRVGKSFSYYAAFLHRNEDSEPLSGMLMMIAFI